jgi:hypothetical protein
MGIWGNLSLIRMNENASTSVRKGIRQVEQLIHQESALIHLAFGHHAESHAALRHVQLNRLLKQIKKERLLYDDVLDINPIESNEGKVSRLTSPYRMVRRITPLVEQMFHRIDKGIGKVSAQAVPDGAVQARLLRIDALIKRGFALVGQFRRNAGRSKSYRPYRFPIHATVYAVQGETKRKMKKVQKTSPSGVHR